MGKRVVVAPTATEQNATPPITRTIRKRKRNLASNGAIAKNVRLSGTGAAVSVTSKNNNLHHNYNWHENDDEDSYSIEAALLLSMAPNQFAEYANPSYIIIKPSLNNERGMSSDVATIESPKPVYTLRPSLVNGVILHDLMQKSWRLGRPIGKGNFGEIFLASDNITAPVTNENAKFVVKIEPHSNGPLFVEIHCLMNTARKDSVHVNNDNKQKGKDEKGAHVATLPQLAPSGIPSYIASGSHYFGDARYRFLVLDRFDRDLHSLIKNCRVHQKSVLTLAVQIVNVLENLHNKGYCHNDVKAQNLMISKCKYYKRKESATGNGKLAASGNNHRKRYDEHYEEKQPTTDSGNSSEQELNEDEDMEEEKFILKRKAYAQDLEDDEDFDDGATTNSNNSNSMDIYETPVNRNRNRRLRKTIEFSGSNPVRSCRRQKRNSIYEEMVKSHYLRPTKRISYSEFFNEDGSVHGDGPNGNSSSADESEEFLPIRSRRTAKKLSQLSAHTSSKRLTRRQEKLLASNSSGNQQHVIQHQQQQQHQHQQRDRERERERNIVATPVLEAIEEERIFLIDFGLASKFTDRGVHRPFVMDQRRAHDGTLEFTSRDAHMGAHSRRSDLECLGYNLIFWSQGYLPWKDAAMQHQQEKVHRAKEYLMTDVRELLKQIYGKQVPKYLGEFLHHVSQLAYNERPDYALYRRIFEREFQQLGYSLSEMRLDSREITRTCIRVKEEIENKNDIFELGKPSINNNLTIGTPFQERTLSNRVSPKNLRSKSDKKALKKKKFSWAEVLSQDPDQIARERAEKEFDREEELSDIQQPTVRRYEGKPTYAILEIQQRMRSSGRLIQANENVNSEKVENKIEDDDIQEIESDEDDIEMEEIANNMETDDETDEDDSTEDDETEEDDKDERNDKDIDSDATEASDQLNNNHNGRVRRVRSQNAVTITSRKSSSKGTNGRSIKINGSTNEKRTSPNKMKSRTRSNATTTTTTATTVLQTNSKRGRATRCGRNTFKSNGLHTGAETGNFHLTEKQNHSSSYLEQDRQQRFVNGHTNGTAGYERRTRRCLIKTDTSTTTNTDLKASEGEESNSNFSPDVRSLFNVWKKINNETMYYRGSSTAARHYKK